MKKTLIAMLVAVIGLTGSAVASEGTSYVPAVYTGESAQFELVGKRHKRHRHHRHHHRRAHSHRHHHHHRHYRSYDYGYYPYRYRNYRSYYIGVPGFGSFYYR